MNVLEEVVKNIRAELEPIYGRRESEAIIRLIFFHLKGWNLTDILVNNREELSPFILEEINKIVLRLKNYEPIQYITGLARFHGLDLKIAPGVLIPRPETEELVDIIIRENGEMEDLEILDIGTGSGAIAVSLARSLKFPRITAIDFSEQALEIARKNADSLKVKISFVRKDILKEKIEGRYDIIVSNPPYVAEREKTGMERNVLDFEPITALFVPDDNPLLFYKKILEIASYSLVEKGRIYLEINPLFASDLKRLIISKGYEDVDIIRDSFGKERFIRATKI